MKEIIDQSTVAAILDQLTAGYKARIFEGNTQRPFAVQVVTLDLTNAVLETNPYKINFPFKTIYIQAATDATTTLSMKVQTQDSYQGAIPLKLNDVFRAEYPQSSANFFWSAQSGKSITMILFVDADFQSGSLISTLQGSISIGYGTSNALSQITLGVATATIICAALGTRKKATFQNNTGAAIWIGPSTVTNAAATKGIELSPGAAYEWLNTSALYGYSVAGGNVTLLEET